MTLQHRAPSALHIFYFFSHNWSYLWLSVSSTSWNTPAAVSLGLTLNNELLVNIIHWAMLTNLTNACVAILTAKKKMSDLREKMKPTSLRVSFIPECAWGRAAFSCAAPACVSLSGLQGELVCPRSSGNVAAAGRHMWLHVRLLQEHTAAAAGKRPALPSAA